MAKIVERGQMVHLLNDTPYNFVIEGCIGGRSQSLAGCYQDYRITAVKVCFFPIVNTVTFSDVSGGNRSELPELFTKVLDVPAPATWNLQWLEEMDGKVSVLDQKNVVHTYKPKVDMLASTAGGSGVIIKNSPWLSTNANAATGGTFAPDDTKHFGLVAWVTANIGTGHLPAPINLCRVEYEVFYEFRKPFSLVDASPTNLATITISK